MAMQKILKKKLNDLKSLCITLKVKKLYAFGSVVSKNFMENSDIDFLISFSENLTVEEYTNNYFILHYELRELFHREIDIVTERMLSNPYFIERVDETKELLYEA
jgi:predicted nucleotidyltransferase